jgi:hypothetical protein
MAGARAQPAGHDTDLGRRINARWATERPGLFQQHAAFAAPAICCVPPIVDRLDGLLLAIELAMGRMSVHTLDALKTRTVRPLRNLNPPRRYAPSYQHSSGSRLRRSRDRPSGAERQRLTRLAIFSSTFLPTDTVPLWARLLAVRSMLSSLVASLLMVSHTLDAPTYQMLRLVHRCIQALGGFEEG